MTSFFSLPYELQQQILDNALSLDLCVYKAKENRHEVQPIEAFQDLATNLVLGLPFLKERVIELCTRRLT